jgi:universal stress protein E
MRRFSNILFSPLGETDNAAAARRIADLAARNEAQLTMLGVIAEPSRFQRLLHRSELNDTIQEAERKALATKLARWASKSGDVQAETRIDVGNPALTIIERVLIAGHDLVVVTTDDDDEDHATIKRLLRKCPCPVWVIRPTRARTQRVLAAVNPDPAEADLNRTILELASSMVNLYGGELHVVHAWSLYGQETMTSSAFLHITAEEIDELVQSERARRSDALDEVLTSSGVTGEPWRIHLHQGPPARIVCEAVDKYRINLLVMGTVARTGVRGLIMGNTAEKVLDSARCSVVAVKPPGFVSPLELTLR